jgi:hypothetical protein
MVAERKDGAQGVEGEVAIAEEEEEQEEHDDKLGDDADGVPEESGQVSADIGCSTAGGVVDIDGAGEGFDAGGELGTVGDEAGEPFLVGSGAKGVDGVVGLFADLLGEEEGGDNYGEGDKNERNGGAEGRIFDLCGEPVVRMPGYDSEDDSSGDGGKEGLEEESADDEDAEGEEEEGDLLPWVYCRVILHEVSLRLVGCRWMEEHHFLTRES